MNYLSNPIFRLSFSFVFFAAAMAGAESVQYTLVNVILDDNTQMSGTFTWTYDSGDFANGTGQFDVLEIPHTAHDHTDLDATIDATESIEITLAGSTHDDGVDITLVLTQPLSPDSSSTIDLKLSRYEIGGNGFHDGCFLSGTIAVVDSTVPGDVNLDGIVNLLDVVPFVDRISSGIYQAEADVNMDGLVNLLDVDPFISILSGG